MYHILNIGAGSGREAFSTSDATVSTAELPPWQDMSSENNLASSSPFQQADSDSINHPPKYLYIFTVGTFKLFLLHT